MNAQMSSAGRRPICLPTAKLQCTTIILLIMVQSGDIKLNPGPRQASIFPCGMCEIPVTLSNEGACCDCCSMWHHKSCIELCTTDYELLQRSNVQWMCWNCDSLNVSSFTYHLHKIENISYYEPLNTTESFLDSLTSQFSTLKTSSPKSAQNNSKSHRKEPNSTNKSRSESKSIPNLPPKRNLRILTVNCRSIKDKTSELKAFINYTKPDIVIRTESWLKGVKPGKNPTTDAIKSAEVFPDNYTAYRNDRGTLGGGVFIIIQNNIIAIEQPQYVTKCELDWVKIKLKRLQRSTNWFILHAT